MSYRPIILGVVLLGVLFGPNLQVRAAGPLNRVPNTTLTNLPPTPPLFGYVLINALPGLTFDQPVAITSPPGETNRLFILQKTGRIMVITNLANPNPTEFMNLPVVTDSECGLLGLAFHPGYATNGYFYVFSSRSLATSQGTGLHQCISRFQTSPPNAHTANPATELFLLRQRDTAPNHNGGDLHFGMDGYLYASVGDEGAQYNGNGNAQIITNKFFSAILRLDVDKRAGNLPANIHPANSTNYFIPADNPFVGLSSYQGQTFNPANVRTEFYSIGYRNPWRMSFDPGTGYLYVADVGQDLYEEISVITNGANAGWAYFEGAHLAKPLYPSQAYIYANPPAGLTPPIQEYPHGSGNLAGDSVSGGLVYRGTRISQLYGAYVFGDYSSGNIWMLRYDGTNTVPYERITGANGPVAFGRDPRNGDVLVAQINNGQIGRLDYSATPTGAPLPPTLADTGAFSNLTTLAPNPGIVPYDINVPFWSDHALKSRWFSVPNTNLTLTFSATDNWLFPTGTVWIKHFELELTNGVPASRKRLETRFLVRNPGGIYGITYRWNTTTNATLVPEAGMDELFTISDGGILSTQVWHYPSRSECQACHTAQSSYAGGFNTAQLNRDFSYDTATTNQIEALRLAGYFGNSISNHFLLPRLRPADDATVSREFRVRSYLEANCAYCHRPNGVVAAQWDGRISTPGPQTGIIDGNLHNNFGHLDARVIAPGSLTNSILFQRIAQLGSGHMPPLATSVVNTQAVALLAVWITNDLPNYVSYASWQTSYFGSTNAAAAALQADPDGDRAKNYLEYLTRTVPTNAASGWGVSITLSNGAAQIVIPHIANRAVEVQTTTNMLSPNSWSALNQPDNAPFFPTSNRTTRVTDPASGTGPKYYRVRVYEP